MNKKALSVLLAFSIMGLLIVAACASSPYTKPQTSPSPQPSAPQVQVEEQTTSSPSSQPAPVAVMTDETRNKLGERFTIATPLEVSETFKTMRLGETYVFAVGVTNTNTGEDEFLVSIDFDKATDKYTNSITSNESLLVGWTEKNSYQPVHLKNLEQQVFGLIMTPTMFANGATASPGTYMFTVKVFQRDNLATVSKPYAEKQITVQLT